MGKKRGRNVRKTKRLTSDEPEHLTKAPHSFVFHRGPVGKYVLALVRDMRKVMEPFTAINLKARKKNSLKDFVSVSGLLHVSHMLVFTCTDEGPYLRIAKLPHGPTLTFKIHDYVLARDIATFLKKQYSHPLMYQAAPLAVINGFSGDALERKLMVATFQTMFPTINVTKIKLTKVRRCTLFNYNSDTNMIDVRHYYIKVTPVGLSKAVKKLVTNKVPNLGHFGDISDFIEKADVLSESEGEDDPNSHVQLSSDIKKSWNVAGNKSAVRLSEIGPRMTLQLIKVESGIFDGEVMFHEYIHKSEEEKAELIKLREQAKSLKAQRRHEQMENVKKKLALKEELKKKSLEGMRKKIASRIAEKQHEKEVSQEITKNDEDDDAEWYRKEVGEEPEPELFKKPAKPSLKRKFEKEPFWQRKKMKNDGKDSDGNTKKTVRWKDDEAGNKKNVKHYPKGSSKIRTSPPKSLSKFGAKSAFRRSGISQPVRRKLGTKVKKGKRY